MTAGLTYDTPTSRKPGAGASSALVDLDTLAGSPLLSDDIDDNKYKRKSALEMLVRWGKTLLGPGAGRRKRGSRAQRLAMVAGLAVLAFVTFVVVMSYLGRGGADDPMLEPLNNPNIHVGAD